MLLQKSFVGIRKRRSAAIESEEKKIHIKHERREHALAEIQQPSSWIKRKQSWQS
jgi:hypothetical protein